MKATDCSTAWKHRATRRSWYRHMALNILSFFCWAGGWITLLDISLRIPNWVVWVFMPYFLFAPYRMYLQIRGNIPLAFRMLKVLRVYPWQILHNVPRGLAKHPDVEDDRMWFEFTCPTDPREKIPLLFHNHLRSEWWSKRIGGPRTKEELKAQIEPIWLAGDPRFLTVVGAPSEDGNSPKRLQYLYQLSAMNPRFTYGGWTVTQPDLERAHRAGSHIPSQQPDPLPPKRSR